MLLLIVLAIVGSGAILVSRIGSRPEDPAAGAAEARPHTHGPAAPLPSAST
jgi:hypothetical protein